VAGRSPEPARVMHAPSPVANKLPVWPDMCWFFCCFIPSLVFLRFFQSLPMNFADIMGLFLGLVSLDRPSLFSSGALL
jgi:hypothetical protein